MATISLNSDPSSNVRVYLNSVCESGCEQPWMRYRAYQIFLLLSVPRAFHEATEGPTTYITEVATSSAIEGIVSLQLLKSPPLLQIHLRHRSLGKLSLAPSVCISLFAHPLTTKFVKKCVSYLELLDSILGVCNT